MANNVSIFNNTQISNYQLNNDGLLMDFIKDNNICTIRLNNKGLYVLNNDNETVNIAHYNNDGIAIDLCRDTVYGMLRIYPEDLRSDEGFRMAYNDKFINISHNKLQFGEGLNHFVINYNKDKDSAVLGVKSNQITLTPTMVKVNNLIVDGELYCNQKCLYGKNGLINNLQEQLINIRKELQHLYSLVLELQDNMQ